MTFPTDVSLILRRTGYALRVFFHTTLCLSCFCICNRLQHRRRQVIISLTTWLLWVHPSLRNFVTSLTATSARTLSMSSMLSVGGTIVVWIILICQGWRGIISLSLVSDYSHLTNFIHLIPHFLLATSVGVERAFSKGRILLSHVRNRLSVQSTRALMCLGVWSLRGYVQNKDINSVTALEEVVGEERMEELSADWDIITT